MVDETLLFHYTSQTYAMKMAVKVVVEICNLVNCIWRCSVCVGGGGGIPMTFNHTFINFTSE